MKITLSSQARIEAAAHILSQIEKRCTFSNPKFYEAQRQSRYTGNIPKTISLSSLSNNPTQQSLTVPVGMVRQLCREYPAQIIDQRRIVPAKIPFNGQLRDYQQTFIGDAQRAKGGVNKSVASIRMPRPERNPSNSHPSRHSRA